MYCRIWTLTTLLVVSSHARAADWLDFRGPTTQGLSEAKRLPATWSETDNVVWKTEIPGLGWSSPVIVGDRLFITTAVPAPEGEEAQSLRAVCVDPRSGKILWNKELFR